MIYNGTGHEIYLLDQSELNCYRGEEFRLKDEIEVPTILKTLEKDLELNVLLNNSVSPYIGEDNNFDIYMSDTERIVNIDIPENFHQYNKIIVSSTYVNRLLQYCLSYPNQYFEYINKLYVVTGTVKHNLKVIGCTGLKKVIPGRRLEDLLNYFKIEEIDKIELSELVVAIKRFRSMYPIENHIIPKDILNYISEYINKNNIKYDLELNKIYK